jgi:hypothetical protein
MPMRDQAGRQRRASQAPPINQDTFFTGHFAALTGRCFGHALGHLIGPEIIAKRFATEKAKVKPLRLDRWPRQRHPQCQARPTGADLSQ